MAALLTDTLLRHRPYYPVVPFNATKDRLLPLRFTADNTDLTPNLLADTHAFTRYINGRLQAAGARYGIGGYGEHRTIYSRSEVFDANGGTEPRRLHLGTDIWGAPHTHVHAPLDGLVHSFGFHPDLGNYGAVIILSHQLEGHTFYTLYGHLSFGAIKNLREGQRILRGDLFAEFGIPQENGWWPPHLHVQVIADLQRWSGDYPGVCAFSERKQWLDNCIDPDLILDMNRYVGI